VGQQVVQVQALVVVEQVQPTVFLHLMAETEFLVVVGVLQMEQAHLHKLAEMVAMV
jgi:hypothetical protein